jgi:hypothetical protein
MFKAVQIGVPQGTRTADASRMQRLRPAKPLPQSANKLMRFQSDYGNQRTQRLLDHGVVQAKLTVNQPGDMYEQEADRVAEAVMRMPDPGTPAPTMSSPPGRQRCTCGKSVGGGGQCEECQAKAMNLHRVSSGSSHADTAPPIVQEVLRSPGHPLDAATRAFMEPRIGRNFSQVRVHTDVKAAESARAVNALAYTVAQHVVFGPGQFAPGTATGRRLLSHELAHVVQQSGNPLSLQRTCGESDIATKVGARGACTDNFDKTFLSGLPLFKFNVNCDEFASGQDTALTSFAAGLPATTTLEIHGFASSDGSKDFNRNLGCARASAAFDLLTTASPGFGGIPLSRITAVINHGPVRAGTNPVADLRSVVIRTTGAPGPRPVPPTPPAPGSLQTVTMPPHIRGTATPAAMTQDRIPPRVDTPVDVTFGGTPDPSAPVRLSIDGTGGGNGSATINGSPDFSFALTGTQTVKLSGVNQTDPGKAGNLKLIARQHGTLLAETNGFSVSSIPQNMSSTFNSLITGPRRGILVDLDWQSDSTVKADLDKAEQSERIELTPGTGIFAGTLSPTTSCYLSSTSPQQDNNSQGPVAALKGAGSLTAKQTFILKDKRVSATDIPMTNSGFLVNWVVAPKPGSGFLGFFVDFQITTSRTGAATSAHDLNPACPAGTISSAAGTSSVTKTQDI